MKKRKGLLVAIIFLAMVPITNAALEISVATNKAVYQLDETVDISITVVNSGSTSETLYGGYYFTTYIMDGVYDWANRSGPQVVLETTFLPGELKTWEMSHGFNEMQDYPLTLGTHSVVGGAGFTLLSSPVDFQVVPEPATFVLFGTGFISIRWNRRKRPVNRNCSILFKKFKQIRESGFRLYPAGLCPGNKFRDVHPSVGGFAVVDIALGFTEYFSNVTLRKSRILPELPQIAGNQSVFHAMLRFCRHIMNLAPKPVDTISVSC